MSARGRGRARGRGQVLDANAGAGGNDQFAGPALQQSHFAQPPRLPGQPQHVQQQPGAVGGQVMHLQLSQGAEGNMHGQGFLQQRPHETVASAQGQRAPGRARGVPAQGNAVATRAEADVPVNEMQLLNVRGRRRGVDDYRPIHTRPDTANTVPRSAGVPVKCVLERLLVNHVAVVNDNELVRYQYNVDFMPAIEQRAWRCHLIDQLFTNMEQGQVQFGHTFNGFNIIYTRRRLPEDTVETVFNHPHPEEHATAANSTINVTLRFTNELHATSPELISFVNVKLRGIQKRMGMVLIGHNMFFMDQHDDVPEHNIDIVRGFNPSILRFESGLHMELDVLYRVIRTNTVLDELNQLYRNCRQKSEFERAALDSIVRSVVMTRYNNRTYRVDDIDFNTTARSTFQRQDGSQITYLQYFHECHNINLDPEQPMLVSRPTARDMRRGQKHNFYLPPQVCYLTGISNDMKKNFTVMQGIANYTRAPPEARVNLINNFLRNNLSSHQQELNNVGIQLGNELMHVDSYRIVGTKGVLGGREFEINEKTADFSKELHNTKLDQGVDVSDWLVVYSSRNEQTVASFVQMLIKVTCNFGVHMSNNCHRLALGSIQTREYVDALKDMLSRNRGRYKFVLIMLPNNDKIRYDAVKMVCCISHPVPSQCVVMRTISKHDKVVMSVATKIALQIQSKMGALLWHIQTPNLPRILVIGIDVYHDSERLGQSVAAIVGSMNQTMTSYYSRIVHQGRGAEIIDSAGTLFTDIMRKYRDVNGQFPTHVFVYRDGVGDGQLQVVHEHEVPQFRRVLANATNAEGRCPSLFYIIVKKRINQRFFRELSNRRIENPLPGTVIDRDVTRQEWLDFFIVSQSVRQGTVSPTHYNVIHMDQPWPNERLHKFTYWLTHLYYNWPGTIRVPAPCQYAHKLAFISGQSLHREADSELHNKLWFL